MRLATCLLTLLVATAGAAERGPRAGTVAFPADGVVDVTKAPYNAKGDGATDDTAAIQAALEANANASRIIYLPAGTYLVSDTLTWGKGSRGGLEQKRTILQGAGAAQTIIRLKDRTPAFAGEPKPLSKKGAPATKAVIWTGQAPAQRFRNGIRDLTVDIGDNPNATGIQYIANNQGSLRDVRIVAKAGGYIGLDLGYTDEQGPCLIQRVTIEGFRTGVRTASVVNSVTFEDLVLRGQGEVGLSNDGQCLSIRRLDSRNACRAIANNGINSFLVLLDATLRGEGKAAGAAIANSGYLLVRDTQVDGYTHAIETPADPKKPEQQPPAPVPAGKVTEWLSHAPYTLFDHQAETLRLPVQDAPAEPLPALAEWASPAEFGGTPGDDGDDTEAIQKAIDAGKRAVYLPLGKWVVNGTVELRGAVELFTALEGGLTGSGTIRATGAGKPLHIARLNLLYQGISIEHAAERPVVLSGITFGKGHFTWTGAGALFLEDMCMEPLRVPKGRSAWARQLNIEAKEVDKITVDGGQLWVLGYKTEQSGSCVVVRGGGAAEILGGMIYAQGAPKTTPMIVVEDARAALSFAEVCWNFGKQGYGTLARQVRGGETRPLEGGSAKGRFWHANGASAVPLFSAR